MARDYFAVLGLTPGTHKPQLVAARFLERREDLLRSLLSDGDHENARRQLDELHLAYAALCRPEVQREYLNARSQPSEPADELRRLIIAALEDGLLRYSRRQMILDRARELGFNDFQTQLLIAQVQFGDDDEPVVARPSVRRLRRRPMGTWARLAATGVLALTMFLYLVQWVSSAQP